MKDIKIISFDAADTLIKLTKSIGEHYSFLAAKYGVIAKPEMIDQSFKKVFASMPPLNEKGQKDFEWWKQVIAQTFENLGFTQASFNNFEDFAQKLYAELAQNNAWVVYDDVEPTLEYLKSLNLPMVVFSNFDERLFKILQDLNLGFYFKQIVCSTQIGYAKPDPKAFIKLAQICETKPQQILHIGDSFENDYLGALRADFQALYLNRSGLPLYKLANPKYEICNLARVKSFFNS